MQLTPRYGADPVIVLDGPPAEIVGPAIRQRTRLAASVASFTDEQWAHPSRCEGWSSRAVITHLDSTNTFWAYAITAGLRGEPTQLLATFDPVTTPAEIVARAEGLSSSEVLDRFTASTASLVDLLGSLDDEDWSVLAEAPPGHLSISAVAHHALWDSWVHERDILLPLGVAPDEEADEIATGLRYAAALGPAFAITHGPADRGILAVDVIKPDVAFVVEIDDRVVVRAGEDAADLRLTGEAVELLEALSLRTPLRPPVPAAAAWMLSGMSTAFDGATGQ
jgi:uncharacterized protein (TIGR03083 family)